MEKNNIIEGIHILVSNNVIGNNQAKSRYIGFRGELFLENFLKQKYPQYQQFEGGMIISKDSSKSSLNNSLYLSVIPKEHFDDNYRLIFSRIAPIGFQKMYLVTYSENTWAECVVMHCKNKTVVLDVPEIEIREFDRKTGNFGIVTNDTTTITDFFDSVRERNGNSHKVNASTKKWLTDNLQQFSRSQLLKIYMNRLFLDGFIGLGKNKGKPSDIDMIVNSQKSGYCLLEVKEKDLPKQNKKGFGLDVPRLEDLQRIFKETSLSSYLIVRHINNQQERELIGWKYISIDDFAKGVEGSSEVMGGTGMRSSNSKNPTLICPLRFFKDL